MSPLGRQLAAVLIALLAANARAQGADPGAGKRPPSPAAATEEPRDEAPDALDARDEAPEGGRREKLRQKVSEYMVQRLGELLHLSDSEMARLEPLLRERDLAQRAYLRQRRELLDEIAASEDPAVDDATRLARVAALQELEIGRAHV